MNKAAWHPVDIAAWPRARAAVARRFRVVAAGRVIETVRCLDTFDWRLWRRGYVLLAPGRASAWRLERAGSRDTAAETPGPKGDRLFGRDFPAGPLRDYLESLCAPRALLSLGTYREQRRHYDLRDRENRTVCRVRYERARALKGRAPERAGLRLYALKGHAADARAAAACLAGAGFPATQQCTHPALLAFASIRRRPGDYSLKPEVALTPDLPAAEAARRIHTAMQRVIRRNLPGVLDDIDPEFLHDFRVALRRSRSALSLMRGVFPAETEAHWRAELASLQRATNRLRDLDVHLLERAGFERLLPRELHPGLEGLFAQLIAERAPVLQDCRRFLRKPATRAAWRNWEAFLKSPPALGRPDAPRAAEAVLPFGRRLLRKRFRRVLREGRAILAGVPGHDLHALRLQVKKMRYLLDFFGCLLPVQPGARLLKRLRSLQDVLGRHNDLAAQEHWVRQKLQSAAAEAMASRDVTASLGGLLAELQRERRTQRDRFRRVFQRLDSGKMRRAAKELFGKHPDPKHPANTGTAAGTRRRAPGRPAARQPPEPGAVHRNHKIEEQV